MEPQIRPLQPADIPAVVEFSLRAWEPVFDSFRQVLGDDIYFAQYPDWLVSQAKDVERLCRDEAASVFVSVLQDLPVGFVGIVFHEDPPMGEVDMLAVDPDHQRRGLGLALTTTSAAAESR